MMDVLFVSYMVCFLPEAATVVYPFAIPLARKVIVKKSILEWAIGRVDQVRKNLPLNLTTR